MEDAKFQGELDEKEHQTLGNVAPQEFLGLGNPSLCVPNVFSS